MDAETDNLFAHYYTDLAAAFVRGRLPDAPALPDEDLIRFGLQQGLRLHKFKRTAELPRVRRVLGILQGLAPATLLDVGSGRGVFLWPLLDTFPWLQVLTIDRKPQRVTDIAAVARGGIDRLHGVLMDVTRLGLPERSVDGVTILEVLEHLPEPRRAVAEVLRVARRFVIASVPSHEDENPEHIQLFSKGNLQDLFRSAGARRVNVDAVLNHWIAVASVS